LKKRRKDSIPERKKNLRQGEGKKGKGHKDSAETPKESHKE